VDADGRNRIVALGHFVRLPDDWRLGLVAIELDFLGLGERGHEHRPGQQAPHDGAETVEQLDSQHHQQPGHNHDRRQR
jgi:hypothetical protein